MPVKLLRGNVQLAKQIMWLILTICGKCILVEDSCMIEIQLD